MSNHYKPPTQSKLGQIFDAIFLLVLVYATLFTPLILGLTGGGTKSVVPDTISWETLQQNEVMQAQWEKLGHTAETAAPLITERFDYTIEPISLILTALVIFGYFVFLVKVSDKEYRDVIREKFDS